MRCTVNQGEAKICHLLWPHIGAFKDDWQSKDARSRAAEFGLLAVVGLSMPAGASERPFSHSDTLYSRLIIASCRVRLSLWLPPDFGFLFSDRLSDSVADGAWCLLRCTAGANRRHLTLTFRSLLPSEDIASGWTTVGRFPKSKQHLSFGLCWFLEAFGKNTFRLLSMRKY